MIRLFYTCVLACLFFINASEKASARTHQVIKEKSSITFATSINNDAYLGRFTDFDFDINLNPKDPVNSNVTVIVHLKPSTIKLDNDEVFKELMGKEWLDIDNYPTAVMRLKAIERESSMTHRGHGTLTIIGQTHPVTVDMQLSAKNGIVTATSMLFINRSQYGIGDKKWTEQGVIPDEVVIQARVVAKEIPQQ